jgi:hypothetical protein
VDDLSEFDRIINGPDVAHLEVAAPGGEQIRRAIAGAIITATVCGGVTWLCWIVPAVVRWWS